MSVINLVNQSNLVLIIVLDLDVLDCLFDGFLCEHGAVQFDRRKLKVAGNVGILYLESLLQLHALDELSRI